jgi:hypothetical protein
VRRLYLQGRYSHGILERVIGRRRERRNVDAEVGWFVTPDVRLSAFGIGQVSLAESNSSGRVSDRSEH